jgi:transcriptional regulator with XRE-family HTH domain
MTGHEAKTERIARGLTLREVAPHLGVSSSRLHALEGRPELTEAMGRRLLQAVEAAAEQRAVSGNGNGLFLARDRQGLTLRQVADELGWHSKKLWYQERRRQVSPERTAAILQAIEQAVEARDREARKCASSSSA